MVASIVQVNGVYLLSGPRDGALSSLAAELLGGQRDVLRRGIEAQVSAAVAAAQASPTLSEVRSNPALLDTYVAPYFNTQEMRARGLGNYHRHTDVLSDLFSKLNDAQVHGVGRWSFPDQSGANTTYVMPAEVSGFKGMKVIQSHPVNIESGLPRSNASILLFDAQSGLLAAVLAGSLVTPVKTAAQSGVVLRLWSEQRGNPPIDLGILGGGPVAREHFNAFAMLAGDKLQTSIFNSPRDSARLLVDHLQSQPHAGAVVFESNPQDVQWRANVVVAATTAKTPVLDESRISQTKQPTLIFSIGPNDISVEALRRADMVIVDDPIGYREQRNSVAEFLRSLPTNVVSLSSLLRNPETLRSAETVVFAPMGLGLSDVALCADLLLEP